MAKIIRTDGTSVEVKPRNGRRFTFPEVYELIGCELIQIVHTVDGRILLVDEEGKLFGRDYNPRATELYGVMDDFIVGDVLLCDANQVG